MIVKQTVGARVIIRAVLAAVLAAMCCAVVSGLVRPGSRGGSPTTTTVAEARDVSTGLPSGKRSSQHSVLFLVPPKEIVAN